MAPGAPRSLSPSPTGAAMAVSATHEMLAGATSVQRHRSDAAVEPGTSTR